MLIKYINADEAGAQIDQPKLYIRLQSSIDKQIHLILKSFTKPCWSAYLRTPTFVAALTLHKQKKEEKTRR